MKSLIILVVCVLVGSFSYGQAFTKKQKKLYEDATYYFELTDYVSAYDIYVQLHKFERDYDEMNYRMGRCVEKLDGDLNEAIYYYSQATTSDYPESYFALAQCYHKLEDFKEAIRNYQYYKEVSFEGEIDLEEVDRQIDISSRASQMKLNPVGVEIENVGDGVNSIYPDYVPVVSKNDSIMLFTSRREGSTGGELDPYNNYFEDIFYSFKEHGQWQTAQNIGGTINTPTHDASVGLSADGQTLILFRTNEDLTGGDLYFSTFGNTYWHDPVKVANSINSEYAEASASLTEDGNILYFSSDRPEGYGGKDIYRSVRFGNGEWSLPVNLGPTINTKYDDDAPFIDHDGQTLYFSSKGHKTIGGYDIFKSAKKPSTTKEHTSWSMPQNMGYPINTVKDDIYFVKTGDDNTGYYSSSKDGGYGGQDIYKINLVDKNKLIVIVKGKVYGEKNGEKIPVKAKITVIDVETNTVQGVYKSNSNSGKYLMAVSPYRNYQFLITVRGYQTIDENLYYPVDENFMEFEKSVVLQRVEK
ncbi:MAG: PD40 domain-containing protein [Flavobacteriales bacterium]|nr:PD40 domain-containing protein [Flavobacteriales bacterium]